MARHDRIVLEARERRDAARASVDRRLESLKFNLQPANLRGRMLDQAKARSFAALEEGLDVARESKGIIAGVIAALTLWFMRRPIIAWLDDAIGEKAKNGDQDNG